MQKHLQRHDTFFSNSFFGIDLSKSKITCANSCNTVNRLLTTSKDLFITITGMLLT